MSGDCVDLDAFVEAHPLHEHCIVAAYHIYRDLFIKRDLTDLKLVNAEDWGKNEYFIQGGTRDEPYKTRLILPYHLDAEMDMHWLHKFTRQWVGNDFETKEVYIAIHTAETIIYQSVHAQLPGLD